MSNWDKTQPNGREPISSGASRIREIKDALETAFGEEHEFASGYHTFPYGDTVSGYEGRWRYNNVLKRIELYTSSTWTAITLEVDVMASGTKTIFFQAAAPTGWTQDTTFGNDEFLRVISSGSISSGGSWEPTLETYATTHQHTVSTDSQTLTHSATLIDDAGSPGGSIGFDSLMVLPPVHSVSHNHESASGGNHSHTADAAWRPSYIDVIVATKD